jgi:hypothetical protein
MIFMKRPLLSKPAEGGGLSREQFSLFVTLSHQHVTAQPPETLKYRT